MNPTASAWLLQRLQTAEVISFDLWDTVLRRTCHPEAVKLQAAEAALQLEPSLLPRYRSANRLYRLRLAIERRLAWGARLRGQSGEYRMEVVWDRLWQRAASVNAERRQTLVQAAVTLEWQIEQRVSYVDEDWLQLVRAVPERRFVFLSDFYAGSDALFGLLQHHGIAHLFEHGHVSCETMAAKRDGRLYQQVRDLNGWHGRHWVHVGDNAHADVAMARANGVEGLLFQPEAGHRRRVEVAERFRLRRTAPRRYWAGQVELADTTDGAFALGQRWAPLFAGFAAAIRQQAARQNMPRIVFLTREGEFFQRVYLAMQETGAWSDVTTQLLQVSRLATFFPSLQEPSIPALRRLWSQYTVQSPRALLRSLGLDQAGLEPFFERHALPLDTEIVEPWRDSRMQRLFADTAFVERLTGLLSAARGELQCYLTRCGLGPASNDPVLLVDIGWRGSIQNNLALLQPQRRWSALYLGLMPAFTAEPPNAPRCAWGVDLRLDPSARQQLRLSFVAPLEMLCNSPRGSICGYADGQPLEQQLADETSVFDSFTRAFQDGVVAAARVIARQMHDEGLTEEEIRTEALCCWDELMLQPPLVLQQAFARLTHNDNFGTWGEMRFGCQLSSATIVRAVLSAAGRRELHRALAHTPWHAALARDPGQPWLVRAFLHAEPWLLRWHRARRSARTGEH